MVKAAGAQALLVATLGLAALAAGCGGNDESAGTTAPAAETTVTTPTVAAPATTAASTSHRPIPSALRSAESDAEDTIDLALAGKRARVVKKAEALRAVADGPAAAALKSVGVSAAEIADFRARSHEVARLAPRANLVDVAIASNRAFALMPDFFAHYDSPIPAAVTSLDHLDFEAKLQARAGHTAAIQPAVAELRRTWSALRPDVVEAGGRRVAARFDAHVARMVRLAPSGGLAVVREAQHGLDLVDEIEGVYEH